MRELRKVLAAGVCAAVLCSVPGVAQADPIGVTGGSAAATLFDTSLAQLTGAGLDMFGIVTTLQGGGPGAVGTSGNLNGTVNFIIPTEGALPQVVNGIDYTALLAGSLTFTTESFLVQAPEAGATQTTFRVPFTMTGTVQGFAAAGASGREYGAPLFNIELFGSGIATQTKGFSASGGMYFPPQAAIVYTFQDAAVSPTPEPASMLLLGTGLAGLVLRYRKRA